MRKLLNTLFVINEDAYLTLDGENLVVTRNKQETHRYALHTLEGIVCCGLLRPTRSKYGMMRLRPGPSVRVYFPNRSMVQS